MVDLKREPFTYDDYVNREGAYKHGHKHGWDAALKTKRLGRIEEAARHALAGLLACHGNAIPYENCGVQECAIKIGIEFVNQVDKLFELEKEKHPQHDDIPLPTPVQELPGVPACPDCKIRMVAGEVPGRFSVVKCLSCSRTEQFCSICGYVIQCRFGPDGLKYTCKCGDRGQP